MLNYQYSYDTTNNIVSKVTEAGTTNYSYDTLDRLTGAAYTGSSQTNEAYTYDAVANRLTDGSTGSPPTVSYTYNENNQLVTASSITYTYDANGNTINQTDASNAANTRNYIYDTDNRLVEIRNSSNTLIAAYSYDPFGRRLSKDTGSSKTYYLYNAEGLIAEADATGQVTKTYGYAPASTFSTNPLWLKAAAIGSQTQSYYYYQNDHLGTPQKLTNQSGVVVWSATYDGFGKATVDPASTVTNNLRFPGQYADAETGLHYNWNRYYDSSTGRYTTIDPIGLRGGKNLYTYVGGNPVNGIDPLGLLQVPEIIQKWILKKFTNEVVKVPGELEGEKCAKNITCQQYNSRFFELNVHEACAPLLDSVDADRTRGITTGGPYFQCRKTCTEKLAESCKDKGRILG